MIRRLIMSMCLILVLVLLGIGVTSRWKEMVLWDASKQIANGRVSDLQVRIARSCLRIEWQSEREYSPDENDDLEVHETNALLFCRESSPEWAYGHGPGYMIVFRYESLAVSLWIPAILLAVYPGVCFIRGPYRRRRRRKKGLCLTCGYNLTGNVSGVCPECGKAISDTS